MVNAYDYHYCIVWSKKENEYVATCYEFPYLSYSDYDVKEALDGLISAVESEINRRYKDDEDIPEPIQGG